MISPELLWKECSLLWENSRLLADACLPVWYAGDRRYPELSDSREAVLEECSEDTCGHLGRFNSSSKKTGLPGGQRWHLQIEGVTFYSFLPFNIYPLGTGYRAENLTDSIPCPWAGWTPFDEDKSYHQMNRSMPLA